MATNRPASLMLRSLYFKPSPTRPELPAGTEKTGMALKRMAGDRYGRRPHQGGGPGVA
jgi:hypothetical protein